MKTLRNHLSFMLNAEERKYFVFNLFKFSIFIFALQMLAMAIITPFIARSGFFKKASEEIRASESLVYAIGPIKDIDTPFWNCSYHFGGGSATSRCEIYVSGEHKSAKVKSFLKDEGNGWELVRAYAEFGENEVVILKQ